MSRLESAHAKIAKIAKIASIALPSVPCLVLGLAPVLLASMPGSAHAAPMLCVNPGGSAGCFASIQAAVDAAKPGTTIDVAAGTYVENVVVSAPKRLAIRGAGALATVIDGGGVGPVLDLAAERIRLHLSALTLRNGFVGQFSVAAGGIDSAAHCHLTLEDAVVEDNLGAGIRLLNKGTLVVRRSAVRGNEKRGILSISQRKLDMLEGVVADNGDEGVFAGGGRVIIRESSFSGNGRQGLLTGLSSGVLNPQPPVVRLTDSLLDGNGDSGMRFNGRDFNRGQLRVERSTFSNNHGADRGGGLEIEDGKVWIDASTFSGNSATQIGGGIRATGITTITNSTISGNVAVTGGGVTTNTRTTISSSTIAANSATTGGGIVTVTPGPRIAATILADNEATDGPDCFGTFDADSSLIEDPSGCDVVAVGGPSLTGVDPLLGPLQDNGGPTETHALQPGSPAIGAVTTAKLCRSPDQRGVARTVPCDVGAFEAP